MLQLDQILTDDSLNLLFSQMEQIPADAEFERIQNLARRKKIENLIEPLSIYCRLCPADQHGRPNLLFPDQVAALVELYETRGLFAPMCVGSGKTLVTLLAPFLLNAKRPLLVVPARLIEKTRIEFAEYRQNWKVRLPRLTSYSMLGHPKHQQDLENTCPDLLMLDEAFHVRNLDNACAQRVGRYIQRYNPVVCALSGTLITEHLLDYWHKCVWTLGKKAPVPLDRQRAEQWANAVDRETDACQRVGLGALETLDGGFHTWLRNSRGVVASAGSSCTASIEIQTWTPSLPDDLQRLIDRTEQTSTRPDGEPLLEWDLPACLCQLALGFYYVWDPMPPTWWLHPRRAWWTYVRAIRDEHLEGFESESLITQSLAAGEAALPAHVEGRALLDAWKSVQTEFIPNPVPIWITRDPIRQVVEHVKDSDCLIWTRFRAVGEALQQFKIPWYPGGTNPSIAPLVRTIALSIQAHSVGQNLQRWNRNLILIPPATPEGWEQLIGRTHRTGQTADVIRVEVLTSINYHKRTLKRVRTKAKSVSRANGFALKLMEATWL